MKPTPSIIFSAILLFTAVPFGLADSSEPIEGFDVSPEVPNVEVIAENDIFNFEGEVPVPPPTSRAIRRQELRDAERTVAGRQNLIEDARREVREIIEDRNRWQRELHYAQTKLVNARTQLGHFASEADPRDHTLAELEEYFKEHELNDEMLRWYREVIGWRARSERAQTELEILGRQLVVARDVLQSLELGEMPDDLLVSGDSLDVVVLEDESLNGVFPIRSGGYILMPRVGRIAVAGKQIAVAEAMIQEALQKNQLRDATVVVERSRAGTLGSEAVVFLTGEFKQPGPWAMRPGTRATLVTVLLQSGGVTETGDLSRVRLLRLLNGQQIAEEFNVQAMLEGLELTNDVAVQPGDIIVVPIAPNLVYVTGNVARPGPLKLSPNEELKGYSAILRSGGFARFANRRKVYILRDMGDESKKRIEVNVVDIQRGNAPDVILENNDIIVVPERFFSF